MSPQITLDGASFNILTQMGFDTGGSETISGIDVGDRPLVNSTEMELEFIWTGKKTSTFIAAWLFSSETISFTGEIAAMNPSARTDWKVGLIQNAISADKRAVYQASDGSQLSLEEGFFEVPILDGEGSEFPFMMKSVNDLSLASTTDLAPTNKDTLSFTVPKIIPRVPLSDPPVSKTYSLTRADIDVQLVSWFALAHPRPSRKVYLFGKAEWAWRMQVSFANNTHSQPPDSSLEMINGPQLINPPQRVRPVIDLAHLASVPDLRVPSASANDVRVGWLRSRNNTTDPWTQVNRWLLDDEGRPMQYAVPPELQAQTNPMSWLLGWS